MSQLKLFTARKPAPAALPDSPPCELCGCVKVKGNRVFSTICSGSVHPKCLDAAIQQLRRIEHDPSKWPILIQAVRNG